MLNALWELITGSFTNYIYTILFHIITENTKRCNVTGPFAINPFYLCCHYIPVFFCTAYTVIQFNEIPHKITLFVKVQLLLRKQLKLLHTHDAKVLSFIFLFEHRCLRDSSAPASWQKGHCLEQLREWLEKKGERGPSGLHYSFENP